MEELEAALKNLPKLLAEREKALEEREKEAQLLKESIEKQHPGLGAPNDVLRLNIGGTRIDVLRRTLTQIGDSMLASRFSGRWDDSLEKDSEGNFFIDQSPDLFFPLINYLRAKASETPLAQVASPPSFRDKKETVDFYRMADYYGMTLGVYQIGIYRFESAEMQKNILVGSMPDYRIECDDWATFVLLPINGHTRYIKSYEVTLGACSSAQIGWIRWGGEHDLLGYFDSQSGRGVGYGTGSAALDCVKSTVVIDGGSTSLTLEKISMKDGTTLRTENRGESYLVDGNVVASSTQRGNQIVQCQYSQHSVGIISVPCISMKGKCSISTMEIAFE